MSRKTRSHSQAFGDPSAGVPQDSDDAMSPPGTTAGFLRVQPTPVIRRTYGRKRYISGHQERTALESNQLDAPAKRTKISASPSKADTHPFLPTQIPLKNKTTNNPKRHLEPPPVFMPTPSRFPSPVKSLRRGQQDQNALDSPFLEARKPLSHSPGPGLGLIHRSSSISSAMKPKPYTRSRHLSLNRSNSNVKKHADKETAAEALRRKTSAATTALNATITEHSWLVPPPPRILNPKSKNRHNSDHSMTEFSFNPPAESTLAHVRLSAHSPHAGMPLLDPHFGPGSGTPKVRRPSLRDELVAARAGEMKAKRKRHDSILSTDSEDSDTMLSPYGLTPKPKLVVPTREDQETTPRNVPSLMPQLCRPRARSTSISIRPLSVDLAPPVPPPSHSGSDGDVEMVVERAPRHDSAVRALADACASMGRTVFQRSTQLGLTAILAGLGETGDSSPSASIKERRNSGKASGRGDVGKAKKTISPVAVHRIKRSAGPYQLSPRTVHQLSHRPRVGMRIEERPLSPNDEDDMFASYDFDRGVVNRNLNGDQSEQ